MNGHDNSHCGICWLRVGLLTLWDMLVAGWTGVIHPADIPPVPRPGKITGFDIFVWARIRSGSKLKHETVIVIHISNYKIYNATLLGKDFTAIHIIR